MEWTQIYTAYYLLVPKESQDLFALIQVREEFVYEGAVELLKNQGRRLGESAKN